MRSFTLIVAILTIVAVAYANGPTAESKQSSQTVTGFVLVNADTDQDIGPVTNGATLNLATLPTRNLNVRANTNPAVVGSVKFAYDGNSNFRIENNAPYPLAGNTDKDYNPWTPSVGQHTIKATPYTETKAGGSAGSALSITFTVVDQPPAQAPAQATQAPAPPAETPIPVAESIPTSQTVTGFVLVNADTDQEIGPVTNGATLDLAKLPTRKLNIKAITNPATVGSVLFGLDSNLNYRVENGRPYALEGNRAEDYQPWTPGVGGHKITATPFSAADAAGIKGAALSLTFTVIDQPPTGAQQPTPTPTAATTPASSFEGIPKCSKAVHDKYGTVAPDGKSYPTWHPLIDRENSAPCSHQHEHGSNPATLHANWHPAFGYVAAKHGMSEAHAGFKVAVIPGPADQPVGIVVHMGGGSLQRVCTQLHTVETAWLANDGSLAAVITIMGDWGKAVNNSTQAVLTPPECPGQGTVSSTGVRMIPDVNGTTGYEPWRVDLKRTVFGFTGDFTINSRTANTICKTVPACPVGSPAVMNRTGTVRFVTGNKDVYGVFFRIDASKAKATGKFCTDPLGRAILSCSDPMAVQQYIAPGLTAAYACPNTTNSIHASGGKGGAILTCGADSIDINEKGGVPPGSPN